MSLSDIGRHVSLADNKISGVFILLLTYENTILLSALYFGIPLAVISRADTSQTVSKTAVQT